MQRRSAALAATGVVGALLLSGCGPTLGDLPLPGSGVSGQTIELKADFNEALNLAVGATVKVNGVDAGKVQSVTVHDFKAQADMLVRTSAHMRQGATARLRYTTPLGELFVDVTNPDGGAELKDGALMGTNVTSTAPTVEDSLASASLLINGGGLAQLQTITEESNKALGGREDTVRDLLGQANLFLTQANATTADFDAALRALSSVSVILHQRKNTIARAVRQITPAAKVLRANTSGLTTLLAEIEKFSSTANTTVAATRTQLLNLLAETDPVLASFASQKEEFVPTMNALIKLGEYLNRVVPGDYAGIGIRINLAQISLPGGLGGNPLPGLDLGALLGLGGS
ncbi:MAG: hypothetical protein JWR35_1799 [Marmoricola sp.]|nr:hypothetical protein [Marmoricola sp.]